MQSTNLDVPTNKTATGEANKLQVLKNIDDRRNTKKPKWQVRNLIGVDGCREAVINLVLLWTSFTWEDNNMQMQYQLCIRAWNF